MDRAAIAPLIRSEISRSIMLDHAEIPGVARKAAAAAARDLGLSGRDARRSTGFNAHLVMEQRLKELCESAGGVVVADRSFPGTELTLHQPLSRYGRVLLGRATIHERRGMPSANVTRRNGASINRCLTGDLFDPSTDGNAPFHVLLLTLPDFHDLDKIAATYIGVIAPDFGSFLYIEEIDEFIAGYGAEEGASEPAQRGAAADAGDFGLAPRKGVVPYSGEEHRVEVPAEEKA